MSAASGAGAAKPDAVHNEQIKLAAAALNNIGVASAVTGGIVPLISHLSAGSSVSSAYWGLFVALWMGVGLVWHLLGRYVLRGMRA
jgi:hypothetical protein